MPYFGSLNVLTNLAESQHQNNNGDESNQLTKPNVLSEQTENKQGIGTFGLQ